MMTPVIEDNNEISAVMRLRWVSCVTAALGALAFWGGMWLAAQQYPSGYDWQYMPVSNLLSPSRNATGYLWASAGMVACSLCGLCWTAAVARRSKRSSAGDRPSGIRTLQFGYLCMMTAVLLSRWLHRIEKGHEFFAVLAFAGLLIGMIRLMYQTIERTLRGRMRGFRRHARLYAAILANTAVFPILLAGFIQVYVRYVFPELPWVNPSWRTRGVPVYLSFGFWEWVTCAMLSAYMVILAMVAPAVSTTRNAGPGNGTLGES